MMSKKNQEEVSNVQTEETSNVNSTEKAEHNEKSSIPQAEDHMESAQRDNEANAKSPADQNESRGTVLDIFGWYRGPNRYAKSLTVIFWL